MPHARSLMTELQPIPVTVLTGFLGAGKTTLLRHLLKAEHSLKIAVIENEFSDAGIDSQLLGTDPVQIMTLSNGCVCCTIHTDLTKALYLLLERLDSGEIAFDRLVIECTGLADPAPWSRRRSSSMKNCASVTSSTASLPWSTPRTPIPTWRKPSPRRRSVLPTGCWSASVIWLTTQPSRPSVHA
ncbi:GTP-binding protein YjiA [Pseudomonas syringae pv. pisi]|nr:GTP-binding protein YjiA [Pseudomonas syringae pv. pisi]